MAVYPLLAARARGGAREEPASLIRVGDAPLRGTLDEVVVAVVERADFWWTLDVVSVIEDAVDDLLKSRGDR